jgi:hypothetical protein
MIRVGLVGEDPNDTSSIKNLLDKRYSKKVQFIQLFKGIKGDQLGTLKLKKSLPIEFAGRGCKLVVFIRDLDALKSHVEKLNERIEWFESLNALINNNGVLLLNIWQLEALILGDIETFNKIYGVKYNFKGDPTYQRKPKVKLKEVTFYSKKQYKESGCPDLFKQLNIDIIEKNCSCFKDFIEEFDKKIA